MLPVKEELNLNQAGRKISGNLGEMALGSSQLHLLKM